MYGNMYKTIYRKMRGITLIELMIVIVIVGFLAAIAYPNYREFAARAKRNEAKAALLQIAQQQERFYLNNNTYTCDMTRLGFGAAGGCHYRLEVVPGRCDGLHAERVYCAGCLLVGRRRGRRSAARSLSTAPATSGRTPRVVTAGEIPGRPRCRSRQPYDYFEEPPSTGASSCLPDRNSASMISSAAPTEIAESATLKDGNAQLPNHTWMKSVT